MTTEKQLLANLQNAQHSPGPTTDSGKAIISTNAIKHGIFTKDLILYSDLEHESEEEYREILNNLLDCLSSSNQIESLLVEKIAIDFWRLRRTIRFETGSHYLKNFIPIGIKVMKTSMRKFVTSNSSLFGICPTLNASPKMKCSLTNQNGRDMILRVL